MNLAIIEDSPTARAILVDQIHSIKNCKVIGEYESGEDFLSDWISKEIDIVIIDLHLGDSISGVNVGHEIRKQDKFFPIIYYTADDNPSVIKTLIQTNPWDILQKPVTIDKLDISIHRVERNKIIAESEFKNYELKIKQLVAENEELKNKLALSERNNSELSETNHHLIAATWRERKIKEELKESKEIIEIQNKKITESINYSWKIQKTLLPPLESVKKDFNESILIHKPKDVVSGDFPWYYKDGDYIYFAAVDCTGHGVPGAMLSVIGYLSLNHIVNRNKKLSPAEILTELYKDITNVLRQNEGQNKTDGMEIAICKLNTKTKKLEFAGARRPLIYFNKDKIVKINGDKSPIGGNSYKYKIHFTNHEIQLSENDSIFIFSDGITDQLGGEANKEATFSQKRTRKILESNIEKPLIDVKFELETELNNWKTKDQTDDMLLIGLRL